ncbi:MAG: enoyl-CoA hydratase/isomerase family protein [Mariniblastus sp.]
MNATSDLINIRRDGACGTIVLNRPERKNALSRELVQQLSEALEDFHGERSVRAVILTGSGDSFCAGTDLNQLKETAESKNALELWHQDSRALLELVEKMLRFPKPIIAAVNGWVMGSGVSLMLAADIVVGGDRSQLGLPEALRGLNPGITTPLMSFRIGTAAASKVLYSGLPLTAEDSLRLGLYQEVVEESLVWARCFEIARACAAGARESHQMTKQLLNETIGENLFTQLSIGTANMAAARTTPAATEGIAAFLEKRDPQWD